MKTIAIILILFFFHHQGIAQETFADEFKYKAVYELTYQPDSTDTESRKSEEMYLYLGERITRFSSAGKVIGDSLKKEFDYSNFDQAAFLRLRKQIPKTAFEYYVYKGIPAGKLTFAREIIQDIYYYTENKNLFNWKVLEETDTIAGYPVQKATTSFAGRDYTAWFTQEIPFPEGPYKFNGLPGLIVKIGDDKDHYLFELAKIEKLENPISFTFQHEKLVETTPQKLSNLEEEYKKDPVGFVERSVPGVKIQYGSDTDQKKLERERKERLKKDNNPIELE